MKSFQVYFDKWTFVPEFILPLFLMVPSKLVEHHTSIEMIWGLARIDTRSASERSYRAFPRTRCITKRASASEQLRGISLVTRQPIEFPPRRLLDECTLTRY